MKKSLAMAAPASGTLEGLLLGVTRPVAFIGVLGMLIVAGVTVANVVMRWLFGGGIAGLNEIIAMIFAVAVAATLPAGAAQRINLRVDLLENLMSARLSRSLSIVGGLLLAVFFALLARELLGYATRMSAQARTTSILGWPVGPFMYAVAILAILTALVQAAISLTDLRHLAGATEGEARQSHPAVLALVSATLASFVLLAVYALLDFQGLARLVQSAPMPAVAVSFVLLWLALLLLVPIAAVMGLLGVFGTALFLGWQPAFNVFSSEAVGFLTNSQVAALPLFLMMGSFAAVAGLSDDVYRLAQAMLGRFRGGLALATVGGCAGFGAVTGSSLATTATFGRISLPQMKARGYAPTLANGCIAAGGTLGSLIPPSAPIILFALLTEASIGQLFIAAVIPALLAVLLYLVTIVIVVRLDPASAPQVVSAEPGARRAALAGCGPVFGLFGVVIGGLYTGVFTATESAAVGAVSAFLIALFRGQLNRTRFWTVMGETTAVTAMIYGLIFGALTFSFFVGVTQLPEMLTSFVGDLGLAPIAVIFVLVIAYLLLGSVMDSYAIMLITVPVVTPLVLGLGYDLIWWGIVMLIVVETGLITPPFGINLFILRSLQSDVPLSTIFRGTVPFVLADFTRLTLLILVPALALWLPQTM